MPTDDRKDLLKLAEAVVQSDVLDRSLAAAPLVNLARRMLKERSPDPMFCRQPLKCIAAGYCQSDPVCND